MDQTPFWRAKTLEQMTAQEWESLCDGCGRCCLHKLRDDDTGEIAFTNVACHLLDGQSCRCRDYPGRQRRVPDCIALSPADLAEIDWLPPSCGYRLVAERRDLPAWHPLVSGDPDTVHTAGASVRGRVVSERRAGALEDYVVNWPGRMPRRARRGPATVVRRQGAASPAEAGSPLPRAVPPAPGPEAATLLRVVPAVPPARLPSPPASPIEASQNPASQAPVSRVPAASAGGTHPGWAGAGPGPQVPSGKESET